MRRLESLGESLAPHLLPSLITHSVAQGKHGVDMVMLPVHPRAFQARLNDELVGTLHHAVQVSSKDTWRSSSKLTPSADHREHLQQKKIYSNASKYRERAEQMQHTKEERVRIFPTNLHWRQ
ncbi:hypothetical protein KSX_62710 [Ktedonospora formicarum]|uniref:Uncharacterized protein n=1 Tax=Ktedonospora formicarum TaxID=2778364 RepID=A0A8J3I989_9CHLR|nr:hypothetical protein KSX_62710 [Ktedonospora formicarum]